MPVAAGDRSIKAAAAAGRNRIQFSDEARGGANFAFTGSPRRPQGPKSLQRVGAVFGGEPKSLARGAYSRRAGREP
jgi:hypothetical protein